MLDFTKDDMYKICQGSNQSWVEDPTNTSMKYARNRIRASLRNLSTEGQAVLKLPCLIQFYSPFMLFSQLIWYVFNFKIIYCARSMFIKVAHAFS